jgi:hypothetical protein
MVLIAPISALQDSFELSNRNLNDAYFSDLNDDWSAQDRPRQLVSIEPPGNEDSEYVFKIVLACL